MPEEPRNANVQLSRQATEERFNQLDEMANKAYLDIETARDWIDSLLDKTTKPKAWEQISKDCDDLLQDITYQIEEERKEQRR